MIPFSVLDLAPIPAGRTAADALGNSLQLAQLAERLQYKRYWLAEHHNMPGIASAATAIVIGHVAAGTSTIRVGSGGIMLPNHSPLIIAEQFGTLASLFPDRIDLGLGRAPGSDQQTARAMRRELSLSAETFPQDVMELQSYFEPASDSAAIRAIPGTGLRVPIYLLGSSLFSAGLAAALGLPFAFASHFAPDLMTQALAIYRQRFQPSAQLQTPYAMLAVNVIAADTDSMARRQFTSMQQAFVNIRRGTATQVPAPIDDMESYWTPVERAQMANVLAYSFVGSPDTVRRGLHNFLDMHKPDELFVAGHFHDHDARLRSFEIAANVRDAMA
ncbi:MAG: LLM class flavin-dependent oxidoreductase [Gemmatimonadota bacterium]|nr:LLM class flavin-dependent oxidoreductase [Gemmatimonadota bacterium]